MSFVEFLRLAHPFDAASLVVRSPLTALEYGGVFGLLILLTGLAGALLVRAAFKGARVRPWRAFLTLAAASLACGWLGAYWGYVGVLQTIEQARYLPSQAQLAWGALQTWTLVVLGIAIAAAHIGAGAWVAKRRASPTVA